jgi:predicted outer membrane repeat protein
VKASITGSRISDNSTLLAGGGVYAYGGVALSITGSAISGNNASNSGGGVALAESVNATITGSVISNNSSGANGGGFDQLGAGSVTVTATKFLNNVATGYGGGFCMDSGSTGIATLTAVTISGNQSGTATNTTGGGGIELNGTGKFTISGSVTDNFAYGDGGGILVNDSRFGSIAAIVTANGATGQGGGIDNQAGTVTDIPSHVFGNFAPMGPNTFGV